MASFCLWKSNAELWKTCGESVEKIPQCCGNSVETVGKTGHFDKNCKMFKSQGLFIENSSPVLI
jgi:hypothetical protein